MTTLAFIDEYDRRIDASDEHVWAALVATVRRLTPQLPGWLTKVWGLDPPVRSGGSGNTVVLGDSVPGFRVAAIRPGHALSLRGRHRFAEYELRFELEPALSGGTCLRAQTWAVFPGLAGRLYRAAVIGSRGHRIAVRRILSAVGRRAQSTASPISAH
jgi:hypothetical protein